ncbi:MAG: hypothetical protein C0625_13620 [Arcobacter sp.]|nr:MAG: hypothetical protein C0625_13620 [Arcobacter sp.]
MKIISKFSDYYDIGLAYGIDEKLRFNRVEKEIKSNIKIQTNSIKTNYIKDFKFFEIEFYFNFLGFCGKIYPFIKIEIYKIKKENKQYSKKLIFEEFCFTQKSIIDSLLKHLNMNQIEQLQKYRWDKSKFIYKIFEEFKEIEYKGLFDLFNLHKIPYFVAEQYYQKIERKQYKSFELKFRYISNPILKNYKFIQIKNPMEAFQEISMYLGEINHMENETIKIEDKYLLQSKGFDKFSFKKMPKN